MDRMRCRILSHALCPHTQQLYTGFKMLADYGLADVRQEIRLPDTRAAPGLQHLRGATQAHLQVELIYGRSGRPLRLYFDNHDAKEIDPSHLASCDLYFKRSYSRDYIREFHAERAGDIRPLGLNYYVLPDSIDLLAMRRSTTLAAPWRTRLHEMIRALDSGNHLMFHARQRNLQALPAPDQPAGVLFMVTAYDPHDDPERSKEKIEERIHNNEIRAACVRLLRKELGPRFHGGFMHNPFTTAKYRDVLTPDPASTRKGNYLRLLEKFPICVATTGLHGSIGWKFAEYVAFSKAIVSEKLHYEVPGPFRAGRNYLEFSTPQDCVHQATRLMEDHELRGAMMARNFAYYQSHVKPDMLVFNALCAALRHLDCHAPAHAGRHAAPAGPALPLARQ